MKNKCDVLIIGSGIAGSTLGLILARQGLRVSLVDHVPHPRFALGESLLRPTTLWMKALAARYSVPELDVLANVDSITRDIAPTSGCKRGFGFLYYDEGATHSNQCWWSNIPTSFDEETQEAHLFRQDVDAYLFYSAVTAGCDAQMGAKIEKIEPSPTGVSARVNGDTIHAQYLVDASGFGSVVARKFGLRDQQPTFKTKSRALFTHMVGVQPFDELKLAPQPARPWNEGTIHHVFDGGWIWVIPFGNHRNSQNPLCSVGLNVDLERFPQRNELPASQEWSEVLQRYPAIRAHFREAVPVRSWFSTGRLQYSSQSCVGDRYCLLSQAFGTVDALYSRGLLNTLQGLNLTASLILDAFKDNDFSTERFTKLNHQQENLLDVNDKLVFGTYRSLHSPELFKAWLAIYTLSEQLSISHILRPFREYLTYGDQEALAFDDKHPQNCMAGYAPFNVLLTRCADCMADLQMGRSSTPDTLIQIEQILREATELGFDYDRLTSIVERVNFTTTAKRFLEFERILLEILDAIDAIQLISTRLRSSFYVGYFVRALAKEMVRLKQQNKSCKLEMFDDATLNIASDSNADPASLLGISLNARALQAAIQSVQPEVEPSEAERAQMRDILAAISRLDWCTVERAASQLRSAYEVDMADAGWCICSKSRVAKTNAHLTIWQRSLGNDAKEVFTLYETVCGQTHVLHIKVTGQPHLA